MGAGAEGVCAVGVEGSYAMLVYDEEEPKGSSETAKGQLKGEGQRHNPNALMPSCPHALIRHTLSAFQRNGFHISMYLK